MTDFIDLDALSTTRLDPLAATAMMDAWSQAGNPGSTHAAGERAAVIVERGRDQIARLVGASPAEILLTSGATEANNLAVTGSALAALETGDERRRILVSSIEHKSVLEPAHRLRRMGFVVEDVPVTGSGALDLSALEGLTDGQTLLVSIMAANNETGALQPVEDAARIAHACGALFHTDAAQIVGKLAVDLTRWDVDYASISSHKMKGPMGIGALFVAAHAPKPSPLIVGGGQERGLRSGTVPMPLVAGFGAAAAAAAGRLDANPGRAEALLSLLLREISEQQIAFRINTDQDDRLPGAISIALPEVDADELVQSLARKVYLSTGSACSSGQLTTSHVLKAMGLSNELAASTIRIGIDAGMSEDDAKAAGAAIAETIIRQLATGRFVQ